MAAKAFTISLICCGTASAVFRNQHIDPITRSTVIQLLSQPEKKAKKALKMASLELMILHGMNVFNSSSKKKMMMALGSKFGRGQCFVYAV